MAAWFSKRQRPKERAAHHNTVPEGLWSRCDSCGEILYRQELAENLEVCPRCGFHGRISVARRIAALFDPETFIPADEELLPTDPLDFKDTQRYSQRLKNARKKTGRTEAVLAGTGRLEGTRVSAGFFDFTFLGGSMGSVAGERIARVFDRGRELGCPVVIVSSSGGARMQEGILSLMQMAKTMAALARFRQEARSPYISILTHPTTGGVAASFALRGDIHLAEPGALIGFAGPRVIRQTMGGDLPLGFQRSEFLLEHGLVDRIVDRRQLRQELIDLLELLRAG